ncbi:unnamed protein product [Caenorhabditis angaria]|uniref:Golgin-84 n=1 Tax=Caenorhabditis angaria TaxID=860376 RepID=A0A9P1MWB3_9PELO|nr:unnamed protein product [Caenorhabditis angaria]
MSWLSKVSDIAGAAENLLNKLDEKTGDAIQQAKSNRTRKLSNSSTVISIPENLVTEDFGKPSASIPSRAYSEYTGGNRKTATAKESTSVTQPCMNTSTASESWTMVLGSKEEENSSTSKTTSEVGHEPNPLKSQLWVKESQITMMKAKLTELEKKLEKRGQDYYEMKAEKEMLERRLEKTPIVSSQVESDIEECNMMKRKIIGLEEEIRAMVEQLRLAKFNLNENKKEFDEYKNKAQKILTAKEKLVESLKSEQGIGSGGERSSHLFQAEVEEIRVERDLAKSDLESTQLQIYTLRSDMEELEVQIRDLQSQLAEQTRTNLEERQTWETTNSLLNEKVDCARVENDFIKQEMKRQNDIYQTKLQEKDMEIRKIMEQSRVKLRDEQAKTSIDEGNTQLAELLLQKQQQLEEVQRNNHMLNVRLNRLQKASTSDTSVNMDSSPVHNNTQLQFPSSNNSFISSIKHDQTRQAIQAIDSNAFKILSMLRNHPTSRLFFILYFIIMHAWLFFIVLTYTPEIH